VISAFQYTSGLRMHGVVLLLFASFTCTWRSAQSVEYKSNTDLHVVLTTVVCALPRQSAEPEHSQLGCKVKRDTAADKLFVFATGEVS
jgi:hypothetical protein